MIEAIFIVFGFVLFTNRMFHKFDIWSDFHRYASKTTIEWIYQLFTCHFCVLFHIGTVFTIIYGSMTSFSWPLLIVPFVVGGFISITEQK